jgi:Transglycosylase-like domain
MRNLLHRCSLLAAGTMLATTLLSSGFSAEPAGARTVSRGRTYRSYRTSRSAVRTPAAPTDDLWARLRSCESGGRYDINTGNGFYGAYQFHPRTWRNLGYPGLPHQAPPAMQDEAARKLQARSGWGQWPVCSRRIGAR